MTATAHPAPPHRPVLAGLGWMVAAQLCFALMNVSARLAGQGVPWPEVAGARFLVGVGLAWGLARSRGVSLRITDKRSSWLRAIFGTISAVCTFYAITSSRINLGDAATLGATAPIFVALFAPSILGERSGRSVGTAVLVAFAGVVLVLEPSFRSALDVALVATLGAVLYAFAMIYLRRLGAGESHEAVVMHFSLVALAVMAALAIPGWEPPTARDALWLVATGLFGGLAQLAMTRAYALDGATRIATVTYLGIVFTHLLAIPVFGERPGVTQVLGAVLVIGAGLLLVRSARAEAR
ncbi:MAG TPA: DMT family transporter [Gemmatimonadales bacterium]|nr:DMT family transporter [Gemmatimonadales bacterium]